MKEDTVKRLALIIAANCMKQSVIEQCHGQQQISDDELSSFNKQMSDKIYTFLTYLLNKPAEEYSVMMEALAKNYPDSWPMPDLDDGFIQIANNSKEPDSVS